MVLLSLLTSTAGGVMSNVSSSATSQVNLPIVFCFRSGIEKLSKSSTQIGNLIHYAALEPYDGESPTPITTWIRSLITVAYSAEDVLDEVQYEVHRIVIEETSFEKNKLNFFCDLFNRVVFRFQMAFEINKINASLEDLNNKAAGVGLVMTRTSNGGAAPSQGIQHRETTWFPDQNEFTFKDATVVGRKEVVSNIIATLTNSNNQERALLVVAIVGLGGIGKTTLARGSTVIVTTRSAKVASTMEADPCWPLKTLSDDECWSILKDRALPDPNAPIPSDLERIGKELAKKCAGLPLAAKVLGSLMRSKNSSNNEWQSILENPIWQQQSLDNEDSNIMSVLMLSFDNLKSPLKQCFAYCSMFKRGSLIERDNLIQLWMAQGLLHSSQPIEMEDIGGEYFDTLLNNSLFQDAAKYADGVITKCKVHDHLHELVIKVSKFDSWSPDFKEKDVHDEIRHVAQIPTPRLERMSETSIARLRSLFSDVPVSSIIFQNSKALRVLKIGEVVNEELTDSLGKMKHLRYLELSSTKIKALPKSIGKLYNLQTLRLVGCHNCEGVPTLGHLPNLRSLVIIEMNKLKRVGAEFYGTGTTLFPALRTLYIVDCVRLIQWMEAPRLSAEVEVVVVFPCLEELKLRRCKKLKTTPSRFPCLKRLEIDGMRLMGNAIEMLINLRGLKYLKLRRCHELTSIAPDEYNGLQELDIDKCARLESVRFTHGMPSLRQLDISNCDRLSSLEVGLGDCTSLQHLSISYCPNLASIPIRKGKSSLRKLFIFRCKRLSSLGSLNYCTSLEDLEITRCHKLTSIPMTKGIKSLRYFVIFECGGLLSLPSGLQFCTFLQGLQIYKFSRLVFISPSYECDHPESTNLAEEISTSLGEYLSLQEVCPSLQSIPPKIRQLLICHCGKFKYLPTTFHRLTGLKSLLISSISGLLAESIAFHNSQVRNLFAGRYKHESLPPRVRSGASRHKSLFIIFNVEGAREGPYVFFEWVITLLI